MEHCSEARHKSCNDEVAKYKKVENHSIRNLLLRLESTRVRLSIVLCVGDFTVESDRHAEQLERERIRSLTKIVIAKLLIQL